MFGASTQKSWRLGDLFGHPIYVHPFFLALVGLFALLPVSAQAGGAFQIVENLLVWAPTLFLGVLLHELGHATALKRFGYGSSDIILHGFGGVTINKRRTNAPPGRSIVISLAGPGVSFAIALVSFGLLLLLQNTVSLGGTGAAAVALGILHQFLYIMALINTVWAVFNMLPINPLDGGHVVLHALRGRLKNDHKAMQTTAKVSLVTLAVVAIPGMLFLDPFFMIVLGLFFGYQNWQILQSSNQPRPPRGGPFGR